MPHRLKQLQPHHHAAVRMRLEGRPAGEIAEMLEVAPRTVYIWFSDPLMKSELHRQLERVDELFAERLAEAAVQGLAALATVATAPVDEPLDWATKLEAIRILIERVLPTDATASPAALEDPGKAFIYDAIRSLTPNQIGQLGQLAAQDAARQALASGDFVSGNGG